MATASELYEGGTVTTLVGSNKMGFQDSQGMATRFHVPCQVACDTLGNLYSVDSANCRIRKVTPARLVMTFAGTGTGGTKDVHVQATFGTPSGVSVSPKTGNVIVSDTHARLFVYHYNLNPRGTYVHMEPASNILYSLVSNDIDNTYSYIGSPKQMNNQTAYQPYYK
jgi:hypothetical protein